MEKQTEIVNCSDYDFLLERNKNFMNYIALSFHNKKITYEELINNISKLKEQDNIEKILKEWYGPNCLKKWENNKWVETLPVSKRKPKHIKDINLDSDSPYQKK